MMRNETWAIRTLCAGFQFLYNTLSIRGERKYCERGKWGNGRFFIRFIHQSCINWKNNGRYYVGRCAISWPNRVLSRHVYDHVHGWLSLDHVASSRTPIIPMFELFCGLLEIREPQSVSGSYVVFVSTGFALGIIFFGTDQMHSLFCYFENRVEFQSISTSFFLNLYVWSTSSIGLSAYVHRHVLFHRADTFGHNRTHRGEPIVDAILRRGALQIFQRTCFNDPVPSKDYGRTSNKEPSIASTEYALWNHAKTRLIACIWY